jgi:hypothetical protein
MATQILTASRLREVLRYCPETGALVWIAKVSKRAKVGGIAGSVRSDGYRIIGIEGNKVLAHRAAWVFLRGEWPAWQIDHINGDRADNSAGNLRQVTHAENCQNVRRARRDSGSGLMGAHWIARLQRWRARIKVDGTEIHVGHFLTAQEAHNAYISAKRRLHATCTI